MNQTDEETLIEAVNNVAPRVLGGGKKLRGPNATYDFIYQVWVEKAILQTRQLPSLFETERQNFLRQKKFLQDVGRKGKYTDTYGWTADGELLHDVSISRNLYFYFANVVGPFLGVGKDLWTNENSRVWKRIKRMIVGGDKVKIAKFASDIERKLLKESSKRIMGVVNGPEDKSPVGTGASE